MIIRKGDAHADRVGVVYPEVHRLWNRVKQDGSPQDIRVVCECLQALQRNLEAEVAGRYARQSPFVLGG